jgi:hypothetical protein
MTTAGEHAVGVFERKILRAIFGPRKVGDLYKCKRYTEAFSRS